METGTEQQANGDKPEKPSEDKEREAKHDGQPHDGQPDQRQRAQTNDARKRFGIKPETLGAYATVFLAIGTLILACVSYRGLRDSEIATSRQLRAYVYFGALDYHPYPQGPNETPNRESINVPIRVALGAQP